MTPEGRRRQRHDLRGWDADTVIDGYGVDDDETTNADRKSRSYQQCDGCRHLVLRHGELMRMRRE